MTSVSMALAALGIRATWSATLCQRSVISAEMTLCMFRFDGELITPKSLNVWLLANKGYQCAAGYSSYERSYIPSQFIGDCNNLVLPLLKKKEDVAPG
jgi:hypothetical protein